MRYSCNQHFGRHLEEFLFFGFLLSLFFYFFILVGSAYNIYIYPFIIRFELGSLLSKCAFLLLRLLFLLVPFAGRLLFVTDAPRIYLGPLFLLMFMYMISRGEVGVYPISGFVIGQRANCGAENIRNFLCFALPLWPVVVSDACRKLPCVRGAPVRFPYGRLSHDVR